MKLPVVPLTIAALYNALPSIEEADKKFINRDEIFSKLAPLLIAHGNKFGVCLVHRHCTLEEGEMMVATGNVSQPERDYSNGDGVEQQQRYPERWLAIGKPYEFTRTPTHSPPEELLLEFQKIVDGVDVLGLFYLQEEDRSGGVISERTEGRKNIVEIIPQKRSSDISTGWRVGARGVDSMQVCCLCVPPSHMSASQ